MSWDGELKEKVKEKVKVWRKKSNNFGWKGWQRICQECRAYQSELFGHSRGICVAFDGGSFEQEEEEVQCISIMLQAILPFRDPSRFVQISLFQRFMKGWLWYGKVNGGTEIYLVIYRVSKKGLRSNFWGSATLLPKNAQSAKKCQKVSRASKSALNGHNVPRVAKPQKKFYLKLFLDTL